MFRPFVAAPASASNPMRGNGLPRQWFGSSNDVAAGVFTPLGPLPEVRIPVTLTEGD